MQRKRQGSVDEETHPVILFDAECVLCSSNAEFILKRDRIGLFRLASIQSGIGAELCRQHGVDPGDPTSLLVVDGARLRQNSDAVLSIYEGLGYPWRFLSGLRIIPAFLRDPVYRWVARNRYRVFGKRVTCWVAPPEYRDRILV